MPPTAHRYCVITECETEVERKNTAHFLKNLHYVQQSIRRDLTLCNLEADCAVKRPRTGGEESWSSQGGFWRLLGRCLG